MTISKSQALMIWEETSNSDKDEILSPATERQFSLLPVRSDRDNLKNFSPAAKRVIVTLVRKWLR